MISRCNISGSNSSTWQYACVQITKHSSNAKVVFEGVVGKNFAGDIAIDDVVLDHGDCKNGVDPTIITVTLSKFNTTSIDLYNQGR